MLYFAILYYTVLNSMHIEQNPPFFFFLDGRNIVYPVASVFGHDRNFVLI